MRLSPLKILKNEKGFYLGKQRWDKDFHAWFPHERHSPYYATCEEVNDALASKKVIKK